MVGDAGHAKSEFTSFLAVRETPSAEEKNRKLKHSGHGDRTDHKRVRRDESEARTDNFRVVRDSLRIAGHKLI